MDVLKRLLGLTNCHGEKRIDEGVHPCLSGYFLYYYGYILASQPDSAEIQRAMTCLLDKEKSSYIFTFSEDQMIGISENDPSQAVSFAVHRIVLSCVYARNQKIVAVFYHNPDSLVRDVNTLCALECHIFMCKTRDLARKFAERISDELIFTIRRRRKATHIEKEVVPTRAFSNYITYENFKPGKKPGWSSQSEDEFFNGSSSTFNRNSSTTVASLDTENRQASSSGIWESFQDLDFISEDSFNPSTIPKIQSYECPVLVHRPLGSTLKSEMQKITEEEPHYDANGLSTLIDMTETNL